MFEGRVPVMYNGCYGSFEFSDKALREYERRGGGKRLGRTDRLMTEICERMGRDSWGAGSRVDVCWVEERFEPYVLIGEVDGMESVTVDFQRYKLDLIEETMKRKCGNDEKLERIGFILDELEPVLLDCDGDSI
jgi:hypothetical protein